MAAKLQLFFNGRLWGGSSDFSGNESVAYSIQPRIFRIPFTGTESKEFDIAFRGWMDKSTLGQAPDMGGMHIAPELGLQYNIEARYQYQWGSLFGDIL